MKTIKISSEDFKQLSEKVNQLHELFFGNKLPEAIRELETGLLTNKDVIRIFKISGRTIQRMRSGKVLPYIVIKGKCYYRMEDVKKAIVQKFDAK